MPQPRLSPADSRKPLRPRLVASASRGVARRYLGLGAALAALAVVAGAAGPVPEASASCRSGVIAGASSSLHEGRPEPWTDLGTSSAGGGQGLASVSSKATAAQAPRLDLFARGPDNALWHRWWTEGNPWTCWQTLLGNLSSAPAAASDISGALHVFALGPDNRMRHKWFHATGGLLRGWSNWEQFGTKEFAAAPAAASWGTTHLEVFGLGADGRIWHRWYRYGSGGWTDWEAFGGSREFTSGPAAASYAPETLHVFAKGTDNRIWQRYLLADGTWSAWARLGDRQFASAPAATSWASDHLEVFARGTDNRIWHNWYRFDAGSWSGWYPLGDAELASAPAAGSFAPGKLNVFARGADNRIWQTYHLGGGEWSAWAPMSAEEFRSAPATASWSN